MVDRSGHWLGHPRSLLGCHLIWLDTDHEEEFLSEDAACQDVKRKVDNVITQCYNAKNDMHIG